MSVRRKPGAFHAVFPIHLEEVEEQDRCDGPIAQWLEQRTHNPLVPGSSPGGPTKLLWPLSSVEAARER